MAVDAEVTVDKPTEEDVEDSVDKIDVKGIIEI